VLSLAHLDDRQRSFFVTMLLHAVVAWTRRLPGTGALRALVYFDEVMGYLPPHPKDPPTKAPVLTLLKQARAVGVGVVLCTQNPVDVDYKALSNAGTWFVGRLQTRQDRERLVDGLVAAAGGADGKEIDALLARLPRRAFLWRTADQPEARVLRTRQVLSYLRGPLTRLEIGALGQVWAGAAPSDGLLGDPPPVPQDTPVRWLAAEAHGPLGLAPTGVWSPTLYARFRVVLAAPGFREERVVHRWLRAGDDTPTATELHDGWLVRREPDGGGRYPPVPAGWVAPGLRREWGDALLQSESVALGDGRLVHPERRDVTVLGGRWCGRRQRRSPRGECRGTNQRRWPRLAHVRSSAARPSLMRPSSTARSTVWVTGSLPGWGHSRTTTSPVRCSRSAGATNSRLTRWFAVRSAGAPKCSATRTVHDRAVSTTAV
jgi:hypothetical protein